MRHALRLATVLAVAAVAFFGTATVASAQGAFVGHGCLLGPPPHVEGIGGIVIAPNGTAVSHCVIPRNEADVGQEPQQCFLHTAGEGEIVVWKVTPSGTVILVCSNARSG